MRGQMEAANGRADAAAAKHQHPQARSQHVLLQKSRTGNLYLSGSLDGGSAGRPRVNPNSPRVPAPFIPRSKSSTANRRPRSPDSSTSSASSKENHEDRTTTTAISHRRVAGRPEPPAACKTRVAAAARTLGFGSTTSAWALSPGRSVSPERSPRLVYYHRCLDLGRGEEIIKGKRAGREGVLAGILLRPRKAHPEKEEAAHQLRLLSGKYAQLRFANARAEVAMEATKVDAERRLFGTWVKLRELRKLVVAKKKVVEKARHSVKVRCILAPQIRLLQQCDKCSDRTMNVVVKSAEVLQGLCTPLPLNDGATADARDLEDAMAEAERVMHGIDSSCAGLHPVVNTMGQLLVELSGILQQELEAMVELLCMATTVSSLEMQESSLRASLVQLAKQTRNSVSFRYVETPTKKISAAFLPFEGRGTPLFKEIERKIASYRQMSMCVDREFTHTDYDNLAHLGDIPLSY